jgi:hypothetical protein
LVIARGSTVVVNLDPDDKPVYVDASPDAGLLPATRERTS